MKEPKREVARSIAENVCDQLNARGFDFREGDRSAISDGITRLLKLPPDDVEIEHLIHERISWEVVAEDEDEKRLEAVVGKYQLDWEVDYVNGQSTIAISEDTSQREDEPHVPVGE